MPTSLFTTALRDRLTFTLNRLREKIWVRPLLLCLVSLIGVGLAHLADGLFPEAPLPNVSADTLETLLEIITSSMLVIAVFAAGAMLNAYASAASVATPRAFSLVVADDISQYALSTFIGAFIFGIVGLIALLNGVYGRSGRFALFLLTVAVLAVVVLSFVTWVDRIARLSRVTNTIDRVEKAAATALLEHGLRPTLRARPSASEPADNPEPADSSSDHHSRGLLIHAQEVGYLQTISLAELQKDAESLDLEVAIETLPGAFVTPQRVLARALSSKPIASATGERLAGSFRVGDRRTFDDDPRFGLLVLSEIASRALSPAVNDPGTAIYIIGSFVRLFTGWVDVSSHRTEDADKTPRFDRLWMHELALEDLFDDAFQAIGRDGAASLEVGLRIQKGLSLISQLPMDGIREAARAQARLALHHGEKALRLAQDVARLRRAAGWVLRPQDLNEEISLNH
ncbi:MAG: DUF2254 domain-containing protein [Cyanobacteria bacterium]|nr:DUF2254 domain-containing protein [Cyanobacteria bacterium bin.51]